jgi:hypothetical protein
MDDFNFETLKESGKLGQAFKESDEARAAERERRLQVLQDARRARFEKNAEELTPRQIRFCHFFSTGMPLKQSYLEAGYKDGSSDGSVMACRLLRRPAVKRYMKELREAAFLANVLSLGEKRSFLADVVRTPIGKIDVNHPLAQSVRYHDGEIVEIKMADKLKAAELDAKLSGELSENGVSQRGRIVTRGSGIDEGALLMRRELPAKAEGTPRRIPDVP